MDRPAPSYAWKLAATNPAAGPFKGHAAVWCLHDPLTGSPLAYTTSDSPEISPEPIDSATLAFFRSIAAEIAAEGTVESNLTRAHKRALH